MNSFSKNKLAKTLAGIIMPVFLSVLITPAIVKANNSNTIYAAAITTSDPYFTTEDSLEDKQWYLPKTQIPEAWTIRRGSSDVTIAIIDTGIHASHVELNDGRVIAGFNVLTNTEIPSNSNSDDNGHGTAVAGVIGAIADNQRGIAGVTQNIKLMPVKALTAAGTGDTEDLAKAIIWATDHGANIINMSLGGNGFGSDMTLSNAITYAYDRGVLIISAAGNDLSDTGINLDFSPVYPVCGDNGKNMVMGVAALDINDQKTSFSNYGSSCVDISAPGKKILTTAFLPSDPGNTTLIYGSGTSLATPIVSGIAALIKSQYPNLSNIEIRNLIKTTADDIYPLNQNSCIGGSCNGFLGSGRINALMALTPKAIPNESLMRELATGSIYYILNNTKRLVSPFVFSQRKFNTLNVINEQAGQLVNLATAAPLPPVAGTLIKADNNPEVYVIDGDLKRPLTYLVFISRGYSFANVKTLPASEVALFPTGEWYYPPDGTMVLVQSDPTVYVMHQGVRRPVTFFVFQQRKLSFAKVIRVTADEFSHVPAAPDPSWLAPLDGTLVKSPDSPNIYVIENSAKRILSYEVFISRNYKFSAVKVLPQVELDVIASGDPLI